MHLVTLLLQYSTKLCRLYYIYIKLCSITSQLLFSLYASVSEPSLFLFRTGNATQFHPSTSSKAGSSHPSTQ